MKILVILLSVFFSPIFVASCYATEHDTDVATIVLSLERSRFSAQQNNELGVLNALFDDSVMLVDHDGTLLTKAAYLENFRDSNKRRGKVVPESMVVQVFPRMAIVVGIYSDQGVVGGHAYHRRCRFIDTWAFKNGAWVCIAATETSVIS